jgi:hypothetical protein
MLLMPLKIIIILIVLMISPLPSYGEDENIFLREEFNDLQRWKPLSFPKIKEHSTYNIEKDGAGSYLKAESNASASGIAMKEEFNVYEYRQVRWMWKVSNVYEKGNAKKKSGDDYPLRVYIMFKYDPEKASFGERIKYGLVKSIYDEYPPHSSLNYIWANRKHEEKIIPNPYASEAKMILLQTGSEKEGQWIEQEIDIINDYRKAFGEDPPVTGSLAIMNDSDNTGENSVSYIDYIEVTR